MGDGQAAKRSCRWSMEEVALEEKRRRKRKGALETIEWTCFLASMLCLVGAGLVGAAREGCSGTHYSGTAIDAATIRQAMVLFRAENPDAGCPSMENLTEGPRPYLDPSMRVEDCWCNAFRLSCDGREVFAVSAGPDGEFGTDDDID